MAVKVQDSHETPGELPDLHLCNNYRHVLMALASIALAAKRATVVYLEDVLPMNDDMRARLALACPLATFVFTRDQQQQDNFARLPAVFPAIVRRNLSVQGGWRLMTPREWQMPLLNGQRFRTGYLYHAGFFASKVIAARCDQVVLREAGLNNYVRLPVTPLKAVLRAFSGLPPRYQVWGEERWIDAIEVSRPENLPETVIGKARRLTITDVMDQLPPDLARNIATAFCPEARLVAGAGVRTALLLTQPIDDIGICTKDEKISLYQGIAARLVSAGFVVVIKPHPREVPLQLHGVTVLPPAFPMEGWPYMTEMKFTLAVALCSAALVGGARIFARQTTQLLAADVFNATHFHDWAGMIDISLSGVLSANVERGMAGHNAG